MAETLLFDGELFWKGPAVMGETCESVTVDSRVIRFLDQEHCTFHVIFCALALPPRP
jgi:hypothetical protein